MNATRCLACVIVFYDVTGICLANNDLIVQKVPGRQMPTNCLFGTDDLLAQNGLELNIGVTQIYQQNVRGGISKHRRAGRFSGSYDLELSVDLQRLLGMETGSFYMRTEGSWSKSGGIDASAVGSTFGVNGDGAARRSMDVTEWWLGLFFADETIYLTIGKLNLSGGVGDFGNPISFDDSAYAGDVTEQFLNNALSNNPTIPFPDNGLGVAINYNPIDFWYISAAIADAQADIRETGFRTTFYNEDYFFYVFETGITPQLDSVNGSLQGAYRVGLWNDPQPKKHSDSNKTFRDDIGFYLSCDQMLVKENTAPEDSQGLGMFVRYGYASSKRNDITNFWSLGFQYEGLLEGRDDDVVGLGFAQGFFSDAASATYTEDYESALEVYYNAQVTPWLNISPSIQYIANPNGNRAVSDAVILGIRVQMIF